MSASSATRLLGVLAALASVAGCMSFGQRSDPVPADPAAIEVFELNGRVSVKVKAENKAYPGKIRWQHVRAEEDLWIFTPLGNLVARLEQDAQTAAITNARGETLRAGTLAFLARDALGYDLPVDGLQHWVRGLEWPDGGTTTLTKDAQGRTATLIQGPWEITYLAWTSNDPGALPTKLNAENSEMKLNLVIDQWKFRNLERERSP